MFQKIKLTTQCITLIGMPGSGKSTLGVQLAKRLRLNFFDTDKLIETRVNMSLQTWLNKHDYLQLRKLEENILLETRFAQGVIATGGSVVYSEKSMQKLVALGPCIYLQISQQTMLQRIGNGADRGLAISANTTFADMYEERTPLYLKWATNVVNCDQHSPDILVEQLIHICPSLQY